MPSGWALALVLPAAVVSLVDWRKGLYAMLAVGLLQDPVRKVAEDKPVYFTVLVGVAFAVLYLRAQATKRFTSGQIPGWKHFLRAPSILLAVLLTAQAAHSIVKYGNPMIAGIGALSYLAPLPAMLAGYHFAVSRGRAGVERWLAWYLVGVAVMLPGIVMEFAGFEWAVLGDVGEGFQLVQEDAVLTAHAGFFRASEPAAWHTATLVCFLMLGSTLRKLSTRQTVTAIVVVIAVLAVGMLTGRRKIFVEILIFLSAYVSLLLLFGKGGIKLAASVFLGGLLSYGIVAWFVVERPYDPAAAEGARFQRYAERSATVGSGVSDRVVGLGIEPVQWAIDDYGWLGGGLGVASQGTQHFGGGSEVFGGAGEGGLGKITAELGLPGLAVVLWFGVAVVRFGWHVLAFVSRRSAPVARLAYGLAAFLIANLAVFFVATQVFGDLFVLLLLGLVAGFFVATPELALREQARGVARGAVPPPRTPITAPAMLARGARGN